MSYLAGSFVMRRSGVRVPKLAPLKIKKLAIKRGLFEEIRPLFSCKKA